MRKIFILLFSILVIAGNFANAQSLDDILAKHNKAMGQDKLAEVKSYTAQAVINQMGMELSMTMKMKRPDKFIMEMDVQGQKMVQAYDGKIGWQIAPWISPDPQELLGAELNQAKDQSNIDGPFYKYQEKGLKAELIGKEKMNDKDVFHIDLTSKSGEVQSYYLDADSFYILSIKRKVKSQGTEMEIESKMSDYQVKDGVAIAMNIESVTPMGSVTIKINKVDFNAEMDDAIFKKPTK
jgi:outer membrane lipoprotein-sorting protein